MNNRRLNELLIDLRNSLLQYVGESSPWTEYGEHASRAVLERLIALQQEDANRLADLLAERGHTTDFGIYPPEYTDLHYVALDYLLGQMIQNQKELVNEVEAAGEACSSDAEASAALFGIRERERGILQELQQLVASRRGENWVRV